MVEQNVLLFKPSRVREMLDGKRLACSAKIRTSILGKGGRNVRIVLWRWQEARVLVCAVEEEP